MPRKTEGFPGTETGPMSLPKMDRPSVMFAHLLDAVAIEDEAEGFTKYLMCAVCSERVCEVEDGDTMRVLLNTALAHKCDL